MGRSSARRSTDIFPAWPETLSLPEPAIDRDSQRTEAPSQPVRPLAPATGAPIAWLAAPLPIELPSRGRLQRDPRLSAQPTGLLVLLLESNTFARPNAKLQPLFNLSSVRRVGELVSGLPRAWDEGRIVRWRQPAK